MNTIIYSLHLILTMNIFSLLLLQFENLQKEVMGIIPKLWQGLLYTFAFLHKLSIGINKFISIQSSKIKEADSAEFWTTETFWWSPLPRENM